MTLITALKENKNDVRKKVLIATAVTVGVIATAIVLTKMRTDRVDVLVLSEDGVEALADAVTE